MSFKDSEKIEIFKKLRNQINKFKNEMYTQSDHNKLPPFKQDPSKYFEKFVTLLSLINDVESSTDLAELKTEQQKVKSQLEKTRSEKQRYFSDLSKVTQEYHELEKDY